MATVSRVGTASGAVYPRRLTLRRRRAVHLRPMDAQDADALHMFFTRIPDEDLLFLRRDVTDRAVIESWALDISRDKTYTLLAERAGHVVGEAGIHRSRVPWSAHVGEIRVVVDTEHRQLGLGSARVQTIFLEALARGIEKIIAEMTPDQKGAINVFQKLGFRVEGLLRDHVRDHRGRKHDLIVMAHDVYAENYQLACLGVTKAVQGQ